MTTDHRLAPSGQAALAYKLASGAAFARTGDELGELLQLLLLGR